MNIKNDNEYRVKPNKLLLIKLEIMKTKVKITSTKIFRFILINIFLHSDISANTHLEIIQIIILKTVI